jgi:hypothetical protein
MIKVQHFLLIIIIRYKQLCKCKYVNSEFRQEVPALRSPLDLGRH